MRDLRKDSEPVGLPSPPPPLGALRGSSVGGPSPPPAGGSLPECSRRFADLRLRGFHLAGVPARSGAAEIKMLVLAGTFVVLFSFQMKEKTNNNNNNKKTHPPKNTYSGSSRRRHPIKNKTKQNNPNITTALKCPSWKGSEANGNSRLF